VSVVELSKQAFFGFRVMTLTGDAENGRSSATNSVTDQVGGKS
jgi:hypothetical protein